MALYSKAELDVKAKAAVYSLDRNVEHSNIVKVIFDLYIVFCKSSQAKKLSIKPRKITEGIELRLIFEVLCFATFLTFRIVPKYISTRKLILKKTNYELVRYYIDRVSQHLLKHCQDFGMTKLREIVLIAPPPKIKIKYGDPLNPLARFTEYSQYHATKRGTETQQFGRNIGKALDPYHYPALETLWSEQVTALTKLAEKVMTEIFKPSVRLKA